MRKILKEFKEFAVKGNAMDMAVGIVIGAAFGTIVNSLVKDVITPPLGKLMGGIDFTNLYLNLSGGSYVTLSAAQEAGAITLNYGMFLNSLISFIIVAWAIFMVVKVINRLKREEPQAPTEKACSHCKINIHIDATRCPHCTSEF